MKIGYLPWEWTPDRADAICMRDDSLELTGAAVGIRVDALAEQLHELSISCGDVVAVMLPNRIELLIALLAIWRVGAAATLINPEFTRPEAAYQINDAAAKLLISTDHTTESARDIPCIAVHEMRSTPNEPPPRPNTQPADTALLVYTSGSTGSPKGVLLTHANLLAMATMLARHLQLSARDHCLLILPLFHVNAICVSFLAPVLVGAQITMLSRFHPSSLRRAVQQRRPTYFSAVPTILRRLLDGTTDIPTEFTDLRFVLCGAAPAPPGLIEEFENRYHTTVLEGYGLTEGTCASACAPLHGIRKRGSVGTAISGQQIAIMDTSGGLLPAGQSGEVVIRGPNVMSGYLNRPADTTAALAEGWLHTGDVGHIDDDGYLFLDGRIKEMIIRGGENIYPNEIEAVLAAHPAVIESAVVGRPDPTYGEVPIAFVTTDPANPTTSEALTAHCRGSLTKIKVPVAINILAELPKSPVGKIDKQTLSASSPRRASEPGRALDRRRAPGR